MIQEAEILPFMPKERLSRLQKDILTIMYSRQGHNYGTGLPQEEIIMDRGGVLKYVISPDLLFLSLCGQDKKKYLRESQRYFFPKRSIRASFSRAVRTLMAKRLINGFYPGFTRLSNDILLPIRVQKERKLRLIGLALTDKGATLAREISASDRCPESGL